MMTWRSNRTECVINTAFRNLKRGVQVLLPSGQDIARAMGADLLSPSDIANSRDDRAAAATPGMHKASPLWYYILKEASVMHDGRRLGPVGSTIIAETFLGLVHGAARPVERRARPFARLATKARQSPALARQFVAQCLLAVREAALAAGLLVLAFTGLALAGLSLTRKAR